MGLLSQGGRFLTFLVILAITVESTNAQDRTCTPDPCLNGGQCFRLSDSHVFCNCVDTGYYGSNCENNLSEVQCANNQPIVECTLDPCVADSCPLYPDAECRQNVCGECTGEFFVDDFLVDCIIGDEDKCPDDNPRVECFISPCDMASCPSNPEATCRSNYCGGCYAEFFDASNRIVECQDSSCFPGSEVECLFDPCMVATCESYPRARCEVNNCGWCVAVFYDETNNTLSCNLQYTCEQDGVLLISGDTFVNDECRECGCVMGTILCRDNVVPNCTVAVLPETDPCTLLPCENDATCITLSNDNYRCLCRAGYVGSNCSISVGTSACDAVVCLNGGTCTSNNGTLSCTCPSQYTGPLCEITYLCTPSLCLNGGICVTDELGLPQCSCPSEYTGYLCDIRNDVCDGVCKNDATCSLLEGKPLCTCPSGYTGEFCQFVVNPCLQNPCLNNGLCVPDGDTPKCICLPRFTGSTCEEIIPINICDQQNICENGGVCVNLPNSFICICFMGYSGIICENEQSVCENQPCRNGGSCSEVSSGDTPTFACECLEGTTGTMCEILDDGPCVPVNLCQNGFCLEVNPTQPLCICSVGFMGEFCDISFNPCLILSCQNGGACVVDDGDAECVCEDGFNGSRCEDTVSPCTVNPCFNDGICSPDDDDPSQFVCSCRAYFKGDRCQTFIQSLCFPDQCVNGLCVISNFDKRFFTCLCKPGYIGDLCDIAFDPCQSSPCQNGATCIVHNNDFFCNCTEDFIGEKCEISVPCNPSPCFNNGVCRVNVINSVTCDCPTGFSGNRCQVNIDPCLNNQCVYGSCVPYMAGYSCSCDVGFLGVACNTKAECDVSCPDDIYQPAVAGNIFYQVYWDELQNQCGYTPSPTGIPGGHFVEGRTPILVSFLDDSEVSFGECIFEIVIGNVTEDGCDSSPCFNEGSCLDLQGSKYICFCAEKYTGRDCEIFIPDGTCESSPCQNDGICADIPETPLGYSCGCQEGFTGARCEVRDDVCASTPCRNGASCTPDDISYTCTCTIEFMGSDCEVVAPCSLTPCENGGECLNLDRINYHCFCPEGYTGFTCEVPIGGCTSYPCQNGATCNDLEDGKYYCICPSGIVGDVCDLIDPCFSVPCFGLATCVPDFVAETYLCLCPERFSGNRCGVEQVCDFECPDDIEIEIEVSRTVETVAWEYPSEVCGYPVMFTFLSGSIFPLGVTLVQGALVDVRGMTVKKCNFTVSINITGETDPCLPAPCANGGLCIQNVTDFDCQCTAEYTGPTCEQLSPPVDVTSPRLDYCPLSENRYSPLQSEGAIVSWEEPRATDDSGEVEIGYQSDISGTFFSFGSHMVLYVLLDPSGNSVSCFFAVTVLVEVLPPTCIPECPANFTAITDADDNFGRVYWNAMSTTCNYTVMSSHLSGNVYYLGSETVTLMFKDGTDLIHECSFTFTLTEGYQELCSLNTCENLGTCQDLDESYVCICPPNFDGEHCEILTGVDNINPIVSYCPPDVVISTEDDASSAPATWRTPRAVDNSETVVISLATHQPGDVFPLGITTVLYEFCDATGNKAMCQFRVIVENPLACTIRCPDNIQIYVSPEHEYAEVSWEQPQTMCSQRLSSSPLPGSSFVTGVNRVTVMLFNDSGSVVDRCMFTVAVLDANQGNPCENPLRCNTGRCILDISEPDGFRCECSRCYTGEYCERALSVSDPCGPDSQILCINGGICNFTDCKFSCECPEEYGGQYCNVKLIDFDVTAPTIIGCPVDITRTINAMETTAVVMWDPIRYQDASGTAFLVHISHTSGYEFPLGITTVTAIYSDASGNYAYCRFNVRVQKVGTTCDTNICLDDRMVFNTDALLYMEVFWEQEEFVCGHSIVSEPKSGDLFSKGVTTVTWTMYDEEGMRQSACIFSVIVIEDKTNPCFNQPCRNGGSCLLNSGQPDGYECICRVGQTNCFPTSIDFGLDTSPPVIRRCNDRMLYVETGMTDGLNYTWLPPKVNDNSGTVYLLIQSHIAPYFFPIATTELSYMYEDGAHNTAVCKFNVTVMELDRLPPVITYCPGKINIHSETDEMYTKAIYSPPEAYDLSGSFNTIVENQFQPGSLLLVRSSYTVVYIFVDNAEPPNTSICTFRLIVD